MIEVVLLAVALAMDAFAVAIGLGAKSQKQSKQYLLRLAVYAGLYFGIAQGIMPLIGYLLGAALLGWLAAAAPWFFASLSPIPYGTATCRTSCKTRGSLSLR